MNLKLVKSYLLNRPTLCVLANRAAGLLAFSLVAVVLSELFTPTPSQATMPVLDYAAVSQLILQTQQYAQHLALMANQILLLKQQIQTLTGHYGMGLLTSPVNQWGTANWNDIVAMVNTDVNPGDAAQVAAFKSARAQYVALYPKLDASLEPSSPRLLAAYRGTYQVGLVGLSAGQTTFNHIAAQLKELQTLKDAIERTPTVKAALDLNTAVGIKNAEINAELLRNHAIALSLQANTESAATNGQSAEAEFFAN